jgi:hypothetical protein
VESSPPSLASNNLNHLSLANRLPTRKKVVSHDSCPPATSSCQIFWYHNILLPFCHIQVSLHVCLTASSQHPKTRLRTTTNEGDVSSSNNKIKLLAYLLKNDDDKDDLELFSIAGLLPLAFSRMNQMSYTSFVKLCNAWWTNHSWNRTGRAQVWWGGQFVITREIALHCFLKYLGDGLYLDIQLSAGFLPSTGLCMFVFLRFYAWCFEYLSFLFPSSDMGKLQEIADGFKALSTKDVINGCVEFLGGSPIKVCTPY